MMRGICIQGNSLAVLKPRQLLEGVSVLSKLLIIDELYG